MPRDLFSGLGSSLGRLAKDLSSLIPEQSEASKQEAEIRNLEAEISSIEEEARACYEAIGRQSFDEFGAERFGEDGERLSACLSQIEEKRREITRIEGELAAAETVAQESAPEAEGGANRCPGCGAANAPGAKFCCECGQKLAPAVCPGCGAAVKPGMKFCGECGQRLEG